MSFHAVIKRSLAFVVVLLASEAASAALTLGIELNPDPVRPGEPLLAQITVTNNGGVAQPGVSLQATVPANVNAISIAAAQPAATCIQNDANATCGPAERVNWALGTIPAGGGVTVSVPFTVAASVAAGTVITLEANLLINGASNQTGSDSVTVDDDNALSLSVQEDRDPVAPGSTLIYTLTFGNRAASNSVTGTTLSFPIPAGTTFQSATGGGVLNGNTVQWTIGSLAASQSDERQVVVTVNAGAVPGSTLVVDAATIAGTSLVSESARAVSITRVATAPPLALAIEMNPDPVRPNEQLTAQLTVTNRGNVALTGVVVQARMPSGVNSIDIDAATPAATCIHVDANASCSPSENINWQIGTLPAGGGSTLSVPLIVAAGTAPGRLIVLEARATDDGSNRAVAGDAAAVDADNLLSLAVDDDRNPVAAGATLTYTLTYGNRASTTSVTSTTLRFRIPEGTTFQSATGGGTLSGGFVEWTLGSLPATQSGQQQVVVTVGAGTAGTILGANGATISGQALLPERARATAVGRIATSPRPTLAIEMNPDPVRPGELLTAQLTVGNTGATPLTGVVLRARMPSGTDSIAIQSATGPASCIHVDASSACSPTELVSWTLGAIPAGGGITVSLPVRVSAATAPGRLITLEALVNDDSGNRSVGTETVAVDDDGPLSLAVDEDRNPLAAGNQLVYTLTYANRAQTTSIVNTVLTFPVPAGTTFVAATGGGSLAGDRVQWNIGSLPATQSDQQQVVLSVNGGAAAGTLLVVNAAEIAGDSLFPESARANAVTRVATSPPLELAIEANPDPVRPGELLVTEVTVSNRGAVPLTGVTLRTRVPQGVNGFSVAGLTLGGACVHNDASAACSPGEQASWTLGTLPAGAGRTISMPLTVAGGFDPGQLMTIEAVAADDGTHHAAAQQTIAADADNPLTLAVHEDLDAVPGGNVLTYTLTFGNRAASGSATGSTLSFPLPVQGVLLGSTGGSVVDGRLVWNLGSIAAGTGGRRQVRISVPGAVTAGSLLRVDAAELRGNVVAGVTPDTARAIAVTRAEASKALGLTLVLAPDPVTATQPLTATLTVVNNSGAPLTGVVLQARVPQSVNSFSTATLTGGGTCIHVNAAATCDFTELANWAIGALAAGASVQVTMPLTVAAGTANGRLITVESLVRDDANRLSTMERTVLVGPFADTDGDGVAQVYDNCLNVANPDQRDTDFDGFGNICDGDLNNSLGPVNFADLSLFRSAFGTSNPHADLNGNGGLVNFTDLSIFRALFGQPPGPSAMAP
jgi:uncharacterized repeat protein (TIGR01451 family)